MKLFVWDFHGVLEKGNDDGVLEITNLALVRHGHDRQMSRKEAELLSGRRWHEYFVFMLPGLSQEEYIKLQTTCFEITQNQPEMVAKHIKLNDHADHVLKTIQNTNHCQILISNSVPQSLDLFVKMVGIEQYFPPARRFGADSHQQTKITKKHCLEEFLQGKDHFEQIISIGDSPGDMALVEDNPKGLGYLYTHPTKTHRDAKCHYKIHDLRQVLEALK